ncbi:MAG: RNA-binding protein [Hyphomonadaceae bacterium]
MMPHPKQNDDAPVLDETGTPLRQCAASRERLPQAKMVRFARAPDGSVAPDIAQRLPGRGLWIEATRERVDQAIKTGAFSRGFKQQSVPDPALADLVENLLVNRLQSTLGLAKKAGKVILGFDQVRSSLRKQRPGTLLAASDSADDGRNKVYFLAKAIYSQVSISGGLTSSELGMAFGRDHVIHGLIEGGPFSRQWRADYRRLTGFRSVPDTEWVAERN